MSALDGEIGALLRRANSLIDSHFQYTPSLAINIRETFKRIRAEQRGAQP